MQPQGRSHSCTQRSTGIVASRESNPPSCDHQCICRPAAPGWVWAWSDPPHGSAVGSSHSKNRDTRPHHAARRGDQRALCTTQGSRHAFGCADDRRKEQRQHHQEVLRTRESLVLFVQPRKNSKRASPVLGTQQLPPSRLERS